MRGIAAGAIGIGQHGWIEVGCVGVAGFEEQHAPPGVCAKAIGEHRACGPAPNDDDVCVALHFQDPAARGVTRIAQRIFIVWTRVIFVRSIFAICFSICVEETGDPNGMLMANGVLGGQMRLDKASISLDCLDRAIAARALRSEPAQRRADDLSVDETNGHQ
ncbi:hypothetical protein GCM10027093_05640 [Paraburkholderia jirisanensis]